MKLKQKLKSPEVCNCPFCHEQEDFCVEYIKSVGYTVMCSSCGACGPFIWEQDGAYRSEAQNVEDAIKNWNDRNKV